MAGTDTTKDFAEFLRQRIVVRYLDDIHKDACAATDIAKSNLAYKGMAHYPKKLVSEYKADHQALLKSEQAFNLEIMKIDQGKAKSLDPFAKAYHTYLLNLEILELQNDRHSALVKADVALKISALIIIVNQISALGAKYTQLNAETDKLIKELQAAQKRCKDKALKASLTLPLTILSNVVCPQRQLVRIAWRGGLAATQGIISTTLSGNSSKELGAASTVGSTGYTMAANLAEQQTSKMKAIKGAGVSIVANAAGFGYELSKAKNLEKKLDAYMAMYKDVAKAFKEQTKGVMEVIKAAETAHKQALANMGSSAPPTAKRKKLIDEVKKWNK